ncbi:hypothetical protein FV232_24750 [Methylobacterium sp. WL30]|nr:hypothetical protein FV225_02725 [Methylobacterium sp. WL93]TXN49812.1 hypothetical protein FV227_15015 [Methylobacterium sp. WL119]TXN62773.1 hypothetical protein FV232_24750 [Methylobacterium sp. WL30]
MTKDRLSWTTALLDLKSGRASRADIREERLRSTAGLRGTPAIALYAWRGRSGCRYVTGVHDLVPVVDADQAPAVFIAISRNAAGLACIVGVLAFEGDLPALVAFLRTSAVAGATELQLHRLAETGGERAAIVADLTEITITVA